MTLLRPRNLLLLLALILAGALATIVAVRYRPPVALVGVAKTLPSGVDVALQDINYVHTEDGVARWRLVASQVEHRSAEKMTAVKDPHLTFYAADGGEQGTLKARNGQVDSDFAVVAVRDDVVVESRNGYTLQTAHLTYRQQDRSIRTDAPVRLVSKGIRLDGTGLVLHLDTQRMQILSKVHAVVQVNR